MAQELVHAGHDVTVYCKTEAAPNAACSSPAYRHYHEFFTDFTAMSWDVAISFRSFDPFLIGRVAPRTIYWTGDACDQQVLANFENPVLQENIDLIFCVSEWHRRSFVDAFGLPAGKVIATRNGFCPELVRSFPKREWTRSAYTSTPFRGLDILLKMFPQLRAAVTDLRLNVFSSMKLYGWTWEDDQKEFRSIYEAARQPGVDWRGSLPQPELLEQLGQTGLFLYPNTFNETSCIAAIEAQASGCVVVTSAKAGLNETVQNGITGICLPGDPASSRYQDEFVRTVSCLLNNPALMAQLSESARQRAFSHYTWCSIASEWTAIFDQMQPKTMHRRWSGPLVLLQKSQDYLQNGNISAASRVLAALEKTPFLRNEVEALKGKISTWM